MRDDGARLSAPIQAALDERAGSDARAVHGLKLGLARLVLDQAPLGAAAQLELAGRHLAGAPLAAQLLDARQECWSYVGSLACGCSLADSASAHAILMCLETDPDAHTWPSLREQVTRVLRCGVSPERIAQVLAELPPTDQAVRS